MNYVIFFFFFFSSRRRHTRLQGDWSSDVCSSDLVGARFQLEARHGGDRRQRLATKSERPDADQIGRRANLARRVALQRELRVFPIHPRAVVAHADQVLAAILQLDPDRMRAGIERVLDQLLHDRCGALDDLAGCDLIGDIPGEHLHARTREHTHNPVISPASTQPWIPSLRWTSIHGPYPRPTRNAPPACTVAAALAPP